MNNSETIIISVGGSLIVPDQIDTGFLSNFKKLIESEIKENGRSFVIICGGGKTCRRYQDAARTLSDAGDEEIDELGITSIKLNAHLLKLIFNRSNT